MKSLKRSLTQEGHHRQASVLDLCCLQTEDLFCIITAGQAKGIEEAACKGKESTIDNSGVNIKQNCRLQVLGAD
jgi:hypothetical protein